MKKIVTLVFAVAIAISANAQKIKVKESNESIGGANHNSLTVTLYEINPSDAEDAFRSYMKKYDGKRTTKEGAIFVDHALVKDISNNTIDIYGKAQGKKGDPEITFVVAFDLGGAFLNSSDHKDQYKVAEQIVKDFAVSATKDAIADKLKAAQKIESDLESDQKSLEKDNKHLNSDIEDYKSKITKDEQDLVTNKANQDKKKADIDAQKKIVDDIDKKLKSVE